MTTFEHIFGRIKDGRRIWPTRYGCEFGQTYCHACWLMMHVPFLLRFSHYLEDNYIRKHNKPYIYK